MAALPVMALTDGQLESCLQICTVSILSGCFDLSADPIDSSPGARGFASAYAIEFFHRSGRDLADMAKEETNVIPIIEFSHRSGRKLLCPLKHTSTFDLMLNKIQEPMIRQERDTMSLTPGRW